jgi:hypothetical protein
LRRLATQRRNTLRYCALRVDIRAQTAECRAMRRKFVAVVKAKASNIRGTEDFRLR